jgi:hypothetical protein
MSWYHWTVGETTKGSTPHYSFVQQQDRGLNNNDKYCRVTPKLNVVVLIKLCYN